MTGQSVAVRHNFETAHRLPQLGGKCSSLHGHSWWVDVTVTGPTDPAGVVADFGVLKSAIRGWVDLRLDHGVMVGHDDPLRPALVEDGGKVFVFDGTGFTEGLEWPTVENVATLLHRVSVDILPPELTVARVRVTETHVNTAEVTR